MGDTELIKRLVIPMVRERSREPGDAWERAAHALGQWDAPAVASRDDIARAVDPTAFDPPNHWTLGNVKAAQEMARRTADRVLEAIRHPTTGGEE